MLRVTFLERNTLDKGVAITTAIAPTDWFADAGFGVFVHFGHASRRGWELSWQMTGGVEGQLPPMKPVACEEYFANASEFNPSEFDADVWAEAIANSGARYAVFTTKHHDGFAMFDTEYNDYSIVKTSPFGRDITAELVSALRARDIKIGLYFSLPDWHHPEYPRMTDETATKPFKIGGYVRTSPEQWARYRSFFIDQLTELLTKYGTIDVMWLDGIFDHTAEEWDFGQIREHIRTLQPNCLVNDRCVGFGDFATPEQQLPEVSPLVPWEVCMTMNESWGWVPDDTQWKTTPQLLTSLSRIIATGGNLLLNVGPQGDGTFPLEATERLEAIGEWIARNREAVHGITRPADNIRGTLPVGYKKVDGGERLYIYCIMRPWDTLSLAGVPVNRVDNVRVVGTDEPLPFTTAASLPEVHRGATDPLGEVQITLPADVGDSFMPVIAVDIRDA